MINPVSLPEEAAMHMTVKVENGKITIPVPEEWNGTELDVEIKEPESLFKAIDRILEGKRIDASTWKFNRDEIYDRKILR